METTPHDQMPNQPNEAAPSLSRRLFLKGSGFAAATGVITLAAGCAPRATTTPDSPALNPQTVAMPTPVAVQVGFWRFFRPDEAEAVEAIAARIIPGDAADPGAREAGVVYYIDHLLSQAQGVSEPTYRSAPFAQAYDGDAPPAQSQGDYQTVWVARDELDRYGVQSPIAPSELYRLGLEALNNYARARFDGVFAALSAEQQDTLLAALEDGEAEGFDEPTGEDFFELVRQHTIQGMFCDPIYGGNRDMVGWQLIGYPGAQRGYSPFEMKTEGHNRAPSGLAQLHSYQPGHSDHPDAVFPVSGSQYFICTDEGLGQQE